MTSALVFHAVTDGAWFEKTITWLKRRYRLVPIESLATAYSGPSQEEDSCHITVDDGDRSFYEVIFPILKKHDVPASLFVSPKICAEGSNFWFQEIDGYNGTQLARISADILKVPHQVLAGVKPEMVFKTMSVRDMAEVISIYQRICGVPGKPSQNMSVQELKEMDKSGLVSIGAHTMTHPILMNEDDATCEHEIVASVRELSNMLGRPVRYFAYPNGIPGMDCDARECKILHDCGVEMAFTTESRHLRPGDKALQIPRLGISEGEGIGRLRTKILLGSIWNTLRSISSRGEYVERRRLRRALNQFREVPAGL